MKTKCLQVVSFPQNSAYNRMSEEGTFPEELEDIYLTVLDMPEKERAEIIKKFENAQKRVGDEKTQKQRDLKQKQRQTVYFRPTVADLARIFHNKRTTLPLDILVEIDEMENKEDYRYNEDEEQSENGDTVSESTANLLTTKDLCYLVRKRNNSTHKFSDDRTPRWEFMKRQLGDDL